MFKYIKALWYAVTGRFSKAAAALQENQYVMTATYDAAIKKQEARFKTVKDAVAELVTIEDQRIREIKEIGVKVDKLTRVKTGAQVAMQNRINELRVSGFTKEQIEADADFIKHRAAFADASSTLGESVKRMEDKETDLKERQKQLATYKAELQQMQRNSRNLTEEKQEALADVAIAQQQEAINATLAGKVSGQSHFGIGWQ
jgi:chromosome segregation ATPase